MSPYAPLLAALVALLAGLTIGKAWERYKLRDGRWIDRRRARESPHYILGLNFLVANQVDLVGDQEVEAEDVVGRFPRAPPIDPGAVAQLVALPGLADRETGEQRNQRGKKRCVRTHARWL